MDALVLISCGVASLVVGVAVGFVLASRLHSRRPNPLQPVVDQQAAQLAELAAQAEQVVDAREQAAAAAAARDALRAQVDQLLDQQRQRQAEREHATAEQNRVLQELSPVRENLRAMQTRIDELESQRAQQLGQVAEQLKQSHQADRELREITGNLLGALKSNSVRGAWGEAQLRNIVESAGLIEHVDFDTQTSVTGDQGRQRPDMILHLPGGKTLPIDAKVPFTSYILATDANLAGAPDEEARRRNYLAQHVKAVRSHVDALANRAYWKALPGSPDFVVAFIPSESLLSAALEADPTLLDYAFGKRVALASPVALWSVLRTVAFAWQQDLITQDARKLFDLAQELYDRVRVVGEHADKLGRSLENAVGSYNKFVSSLETRVLVTARKFTRLDMSEVIPSPRSLDEGPRSLVAPELVADAVGDGQHPALRADDATPAEDATPAGDAPGTDPRTEQNLTPHE